MLPTELRDTIRRTETLAVQSALVLCLAYELMQRASRKPQDAGPGLRDLHTRMTRVSETLAQIVEAAESETDMEPLGAPARVAPGPALN